MALFTLIAGLTGYASLTFTANSAAETIYNVAILNEIHDINEAIDRSIYSMVFMNDLSITQYVLQTTKENTGKLLVQLEKYVEIHEQFNDAFTQGEMQDMENLLEIYKENYVPVLNEIFYLTEQGRMDEALSVYVNRLSLVYNTFTHYLNIGFIRNLESSEIKMEKNNKSASLNAHVMLAIVFVSLIVSVMLALAVTKSIADPLSELESAAERIAGGESDAEIDNSAFDFSKNHNEIAHLSQRLKETLKQMAQFQRLKLAAAKAQHEKEKAEALARSKGNFLAKMSHEIRTPMNAIIGMTELALRENIPDSGREHVLTIKQAGANLLSIINDILDFSKIENGKLEIAPANYSFASLINDVISIIRMRVVDSQIQFVVNVDNNIPNSLYGDETRIRQIFLNILSNAVKFTEKGFVSLTVTGAADNDGADENSINLSIEISDSGKGIKNEDMEKLFTDFVQIDLENRKGVEGTGLGLAITYNIINAMGGDISVNSEYGKGSTFTVTLPQKIHRNDKLAFVEDPDKNRILIYEQREMYANSIMFTIDSLGVEFTLALSSDEFCWEIAGGTYSFAFIASNLYENVRNLCSKYESSTSTVLLAGFGEVVADKNLSILTLPVYSIPVANILNGITTGSTFSVNRETVAKFTASQAKVLVVDDITTNLKVAEGLLLPYKMQVELCSSGIQAVEAIKLSSYDIVFMDHMMPEMDGIEATAVIRALTGDRFKSMPVIALTANVISGMSEMFIKNGFNDFLAKPIDVSKLDEVIERWIPNEKKEWETGSRGQLTGAGEQNQELSIKGIDTAKGIAMTGGTVELYRQVLMFFCMDVEERLPLLQTMPEESALPLFTTQVHALKSASASIGAADISALAAELEEAGKAGDMTLIGKRLPAFAEDLEKLAENIHTAVKPDAHAESNVFSPPESLENLSIDFISLLCRLEEALKSENAGEIDSVMEELNKKETESQVREIMEQISARILLAEYDNAAASVKKLTSANS